MRPYAGEIAGIRFEDGRPVEGSKPEDPRTVLGAILGYARRQDLVIVDDRLMVREEGDPDPPDPRFIGTDGDGIEKLTTLRDAAVDPRPDDFLPPTNAGEANPHGKQVVSPEIHGSQGVRPVKPGEVHVDNPAAQEVGETTHAAESVDNPVEMPAKNASQEVWAAYATSLGCTDAETRTRAELIELYGPDAEHTTTTEEA